jgi:transposase
LAEGGAHCHGGVVRLGGGRSFLRQLAATGKTQEVTLPPGAHEALASSLDMLEHVRKQLTGLAKTLRKALMRTPEVARLDTAPGIGLILAHTILAEIGRIARFRNDHALAAYSLLAPRAEDTGEDDGSAPPPYGRRPVIGTPGLLVIRRPAPEEIVVTGAAEHRRRQQLTNE